jgi:hypothetical protein
VKNEKRNGGVRKDLRRNDGENERRSKEKKD